MYHLNFFHGRLHVTSSLLVVKRKNYIKYLRFMHISLCKCIIWTWTWCWFDVVGEIFRLSSSHELVSCTSSFWRQINWLWCEYKSIILEIWWPFFDNNKVVDLRNNTTPCDIERYQVKRWSMRIQDNYNVRAVQEMHETINFSTNNWMVRDYRWDC